MAKKKILILTDHMPWGHRSIAKAIYGYLKTQEKKENLEITYAEVKAETGVGGDAYVFMYRYLPQSNRIAAWMSDQKGIRRAFGEIATYNLPELKKLVQRVKPDLIISAYWLHSHSLAEWKERENLNFKLWTVIADPWSILQISFVPGADLHLVYDEVGEKMAMKSGISKNKILKSGWWVRPEMYQEYDRDKVRKKLGFYDDRPLVFVGGGSLGTNSLTMLLPVLMLIKEKVGFIFNTGTDKLAYNLVEEYIKLFKRLKRNDLVLIKNMGWIENMAEVLSGVDIVFGKAGPNFLFDVVARQKPFVAITHIGGQEDGNIELIKKKKLGWVKERRAEAADFLIKYLEDPQTMTSKYAFNMKKEAERNQKTMPLILAKIKKELKWE